MNIKKIGIGERASLAYVAANVLSKGINFLTIPIFTRLISTSEMGVTTTFSSWQTILYAVVSLGLVSGSFNIAMVTYEDKRDQYMSVNLAASSASALLFSVMVFFLRGRWEAITSMPNETILIMVVYMFLQPAMDFWYARQRYENKYKSVFWVSVTSTIFSSLVAVISIFVFSREKYGYNLGTVKIASQFSIYYIYAAVLYCRIFNKGRCLFDRKILCFALKLSLPLIIHSIAKNVLDISDRIMIAHICGQSDAGIYGTIFTISLMALIVWNAINSALVPEMFENLKTSNFLRTEKKIYKLLILFAEISIIAVLLSPEIVHILTTEEYYGAVHLMPPLFASVFLSSVYNIYGNFLLYKKRTVQIMIATLIAAGFNVVTNLVFIQRFGYMAAAYTTLVSTMILAIGQGVMQKKEYGEELISNKKIMIIGLLGTVGCLVSALTFRTMLLRYILVILLVTRLMLDTKKVLL